MFKLKLLSISTIFILAGCVSLAPEYQRPPAPVPQQFSLSKNSLTPAVNSYQDTGWRNFFVDPQVSRLIGEALNNNRDLRMAALKVEEARAQFNVTDADRGGKREPQKIPPFRIVEFFGGVVRGMTTRQRLPHLSEALWRDAETPGNSATPVPGPQ